MCWFLVRVQVGPLQVITLPFFYPHPASVRFPTSEGGGTFQHEALDADDQCDVASIGRMVETCELQTFRNLFNGKNRFGARNMRHNRRGNYGELLHASPLIPRHDSRLGRCIERC
jgi:hypothetical protein